MVGLNTQEASSSASSALEEWLGRQDRPPQYNKARLFVLILLAVCCAAIPQVGENRFIGSAILLFIMVPSAYCIEKFAPHKEVDYWHAGLNVTVVLLLIALIPSIYNPATLTVTVSLATAGVSANKRPYFFIALLLFGLSVIGFLHKIHLWYATVIVVPAALIPAIQYGRWHSNRHKLVVNKIGLITNSANGILWEYDVEKERYTKAQGKTEQLLGYTNEEFINTLGNSSLQAADIVHQTLTKGKHEQVLSFTDKQGTPKWFQFSSEKRLRPDGSVVIQGFAFNITELEESRNNLRQRAEHDSLTKLPNREGLVHFLDRNGIGDESEKDFAILILDIDRFKDINDTLGHLVGDKVIAAMAQRFAEFTDESTCVARLGGDEFAVAMVGSDDREMLQGKAIQVGNTLLEASKKTLLVDDLELSTSVSIGVAINDKDSWTELLRKADIAMYDAKRRGIGIQQYRESVSRFSTSRLTMQTEMVRGLEEQISLRYQPIVDAKTRKIVAAEGLARWYHPTYEDLLPQDFIDLISSAGLTARFDNHVLSLAASAAAQLSTLHIPISVSANLSARSLWSPALRKDLLDVLSENSLAGENLTIEITEQGLLDDHQRILPTLQQFREMGIKLALDDYGTGASSLVRLRNLPFNEIKIDRSFVQGITTPSSTDAVIVKSSLDLANQLGLRTVAEGVETEEQASLLADWGCTCLQGFLFSKAIPLEEIITYATDSDTLSYRK